MDQARLVPHAERNLRCPGCGGGTFHTFSAVGVELDLCEICGSVFLDGAEVSSFLKRGRSEQSRLANATQIMVDSADSVANIIFGVLK